MKIQSRHDDYWRRRRRKAGSSSAARTTATNCIPTTTKILLLLMGRDPATERHGITSSSKSTFRLGCWLCLMMMTRFVKPCAAFPFRPPFPSPLLHEHCNRHSATQRKNSESILNYSLSTTIKSRLRSITSPSHGIISASCKLRQYTTTSLMSKQQLDFSVEKSPNKSGRSRKKSFRKRRKYARKLPLTKTEKAAALSRQKRSAAYEKMRITSMEARNEPPSIWSFDSLFPAPVLDEKSVREDLYGSKEREEEMRVRQSDMEAMREQKRLELEKQEKGYLINSSSKTLAKTKEEDLELTRKAIMNNKRETAEPGSDVDDTSISSSKEDSKQPQQQQPLVDRALTRLVEDRINGLVRSPEGSIQYSTSLLDSSRAVQFREGVRLGKALTINIDRLCYFAKKDASHGRLEEAQENYLKAQNMDPTDGRPYLGLSRIAQRRGDLMHARGLLKEGIKKSSGGYVVVRGPKSMDNDAKKKKNKKKSDGSIKGWSKNIKKNTDLDGEGDTIGTIPDVGPNPFLLQALGTLEQKLGNLAAAEELYLKAIRSRPSHAAAWVALAQLRTKQLRQGAAAGRACYQSAERELLRIGAKPSSFVYTAWASMEYKKGGREDDAKSLRKARELYRKALDVDPRCSVAYLGLGVMESECGNYDEARECFEEVLMFDQRNSRVLQAYAIMESKRALRVEDVDSRRVLDLFERALKANPRDAGVYQAYALFVVDLGDVDSARNLLKKGTAVDKRHAPVWQAWGVLETRYSTAKVARDVFQQGIWACAQPGGGQSGGRRCARLWQAWGVLEAREGDHAAARRCFSRALDADQRNVAALTAWTLMEAELGNFADARSIFERSLKLFRGMSADKTAVWRAYEVMEERAGNTREAQRVFQRSMAEAMSDSVIGEEITPKNPSTKAEDLLSASKLKSSKKREVEVSRWDAGSDDLDAEVWMNNGSIEGKVPASLMNKLKKRR